MYTMSANNIIANNTDLLSFAVYPRINEKVDAYIPYAFCGEYIGEDSFKEESFGEDSFGEDSPNRALQFCENIKKGIKMTICELLNHNFTYTICCFAHNEHYELAINQVNNVIGRLESFRRLKRDVYKIIVSKEEHLEEQLEEQLEERLEEQSEKHLKQHKKTTTIRISTENRYSGEIINKLSIIRIVCFQTLLTISDIQNCLIKEAINVNNILVSVKNTYEENLRYHENRIKSVNKNSSHNKPNSSTYIKVLNKK
jgi:hypothetical protein